MYTCYDKTMATILIKKVIEEKNIKLTRLLPFLSMCRSTLYNIFDGRKSPTLDELEEFAAVLNVAIEDLYESKYSRDKRR